MQTGLTVSSHILSGQKKKEAGVDVALDLFKWCVVAGPNAE